MFVLAHSSTGFVLKHLAIHCSEIKTVFVYASSTFRCVNCTISWCLVYADFFTPALVVEKNGYPGTLEWLLSSKQF